MVTKTDKVSCEQKLWVGDKILLRVRCTSSGYIHKVGHPSRFQSESIPTLESTQSQLVVTHLLGVYQGKGLEGRRG